MKGCALVEPDKAGGQQLFHAERCTLTSPLRELLSGERITFSGTNYACEAPITHLKAAAGQNIELAVSGATVNMHQDSQGNFRWVSLLEVGACIVLWCSCSLPYSRSGCLQPDSVLVQEGVTLSVYAVKTVDAVAPVAAAESPPPVEPKGMHALAC